MKVKDNFLENSYLKHINKIFLSEEFPWYLHGVTDEKDDNKHFYHSFYEKNNFNSGFFEIIKPMVEIINPITLHRIKLNLLTKTNEIIKHDFHKDNSSKNLISSILYINSNNGYTEFEGGKKINSKANRLITFKSNISHRGTTCTDEKFRMVLNLVYVK